MSQQAKWNMMLSLCFLHMHVQRVKMLRSNFVRISKYHWLHRPLFGNRFWWDSVLYVLHNIFALQYGNISRADSAPTIPMPIVYCTISAQANSMQWAFIWNDFFLLVLFHFTFIASVLPLGDFRKSTERQSEEKK